MLRQGETYLWTPAFQSILFHVLFSTILGANGIKLTQIDVGWKKNQLIGITNTAGFGQDWIRGLIRAWCLFMSQLCPLLVGFPPRDPSHKETPSSSGFKVYLPSDLSRKVTLPSPSHRSFGCCFFGWLGLNAQVPELTTVAREEYNSEGTSSSCVP